MPAASPAGVARDLPRLDGRLSRGAAAHPADFENGGRRSELVMLGNVATLYPGQALEYDPAAGQITNHAGANRGLGFPYRVGWRLRGDLLCTASWAS